VVRQLLVGERSVCLASSGVGDSNNGSLAHKLVGLVVLEGNNVANLFVAALTLDYTGEDSPTRPVALNNNVLLCGAEPVRLLPVPTSRVRGFTIPSGRVGLPR
jgi:hypothetical protein